MAGLNKNNSAVKRIMQEARELANDPSTDYSAAPLEDDIFEWHCTLRGPSGTEFEGGIYHFRIILPAEYPFRPPSIMMLTPNGRFELNTKICISFTSYHEELWQPAWGVRTAIIGLQGFFPLKGQAAVGVGSIEYPVSERKRLAQLSKEWVCPHCQQTNLECLPDPPETTAGASVSAVPDSTSEPCTALVPEQQNAVTPVAIADASSGPSLTHSDEQPRPEDAENEIVALHTINPLARSQTSPAPGTPIATAPAAFVGETTTGRAFSGQSVNATRRSAQRPPVLLDTAICVLLALVLAMICRRIL